MPGPPPRDSWKTTPMNDASLCADRSPDDRPLHEILRAHARRQPDKPAYLWYGAPVT